MFVTLASKFAVITHAKKNIRINNARKFTMRGFLILTKYTNEIAIGTARAISTNTSHLPGRKLFKLKNVQPNTNAIIPQPYNEKTVLHLFFIEINDPIIPKKITIYVGSSFNKVSTKSECTVVIGGARSTDEKPAFKLSAINVVKPDANNQYVIRSIENVKNENRRYELLYSIFN